MINLIFGFSFFFLFYLFISRLFRNDILTKLNNKCYKIELNQKTIIKINFKMSMTGYNFKIFKYIKGDKFNEPEDYVSEGEVSTKEKFILLNYSKPYEEFLNFNKLIFENDKLFWKGIEFVKI
jgi:hypothetical protein